MPVEDPGDDRVGVVDGQARTSVEEMDPDQWEAVLAVNLTGTFNVTRLSIPYLKQSSAGVILMMSSLGGRFGYPNRSPCATTKRGLIGLTETLALELGGAGIRVNAIAPGSVDGDRIHRVLQGRADNSGRGGSSSRMRLGTLQRRGGRTAGLAQFRGRDRRGWV
ncbi:MAG: SDR family NAD(P)-dependent oxidoreductase, partial [Pseudonocardiaceae bacterium]